MTGRGASRPTAAGLLISCGLCLAGNEGARGPDHAEFKTCLPCHTGQHEMWQESGHSRAAVGREESGQAAAGCLACHDPAGSAPGRLAAEREKLCEACHSQRDVLTGKGAEGVEETRSFHSAVRCVSCHMTGGSHRMKLLRPDDPALPEDRLDSCTACHQDNNRNTRARQLRDWQAWYRETMEPLQAGLAAVETGMKERPELFTDEVKKKLADIRRNLAIIERDGSAGAHNLDYALEIMAQAAGRLKEIRTATTPPGD